MGVIRRDCSVEESKQELILYMLTKYEKFNVMAFQPGPSSKVYNPDLYIFNKRVELEALEISKNMKKSAPEEEKDEDDLDCFDLREEARFSR